MSYRAPAVAGALLLALAGPAAARAATIHPLDKPCYVTAGSKAAPQSEGIRVAASGFTPNSLVDIALDGDVVGAGLQTDANGELGVMSPLLVPAPFRAKGAGEFTLTAIEQGDPANAAAITGRHVALRVSVKPRRARPSDRIRFKGSGFTLGKPVYAHYVYNDRVRRTVKLSGAPDACGRWARRARQIPVAEPATGIWTVQFDQLKRYRPGSGEHRSAYVQLRISVTRILG